MSTFTVTRISHAASSLGRAREGCGYEARTGQRAQAYLNRTSSTVIKRNKVDASLGRIFIFVDDFNGPWEEFQAHYSAGLAASG
jgi:hypothetical protein